MPQHGYSDSIQALICRVLSAEKSVVQSERGGAETEPGGMVTVNVKARSYLRDSAIRSCNQASTSLFSQRELRPNFTGFGNWPS